MRISEADFSLDLTLLSSFACYLFSEKRTAESTTWVGQVDPIRGATLSQKGETVEIESGIHSSSILDYLRYDAIGLWHKPTLEDLENSSALQKLAREVLPGIRVPKLRWNKWHVLLSALLSVHAKVQYSRAWFLSLTRYGLQEFQKMTPLELREHTKSLSGISAGFRMRYLVELANDLSTISPEAKDPLEDLCRDSTPALRPRLLGIRNLGPKVCDCFLLNALGDLSSPPIDVHVKRISEYLGVLPAGLGMPVPFYCRGFVCSREDAEKCGLPLCPKADRTIEYLERKFNPSGTCVRAAMTHSFKQAGWIQAMLFHFGQRFCAQTSREEAGCPNCPMREHCLRDTISPPSIERHRVRLRIPRPTPTTVTMPEFADLPIFQLYPEEKEAMISESRKIAEKIVGSLSGKKTVQAACLLLACRLRKVPVLIDEVASAYSIRPWHVLTSYQQVRDEAGIFTGLADPKVYIQRLQRVLKFSEALVSSANLLAERNKRRCMNPVSLAAACVFLAACRLREPITQKQISKELSVSEVTIRNVAKYVR